MRNLRFSRHRVPLTALLLAVSPALFAACSSGASSTTHTTTTTPDKPGQTSFVSAPPGGQSTGTAKGTGAGTSAGVAAPSAAADAGAATNTAGTGTATRTVQETDLYRLDGTTLYYLNSYRGLMVFDVSDVDHPKFLGRSAIFGTPIDMVVNNGIATVIVSDWYGKLDDGTPFHGSIVRGLDATDPTNIKVIGDAKLGGDIQDSRVVGNVLYAVSEDYGWDYGWGGIDYVGAGVGVASSSSGGNSSNGPDVIVSSVDFSNGQVKQISSKRYAGYGGVFNVTPNAIMLAHQAPVDADAGTTGSTDGGDAGADGGVPTAATILQYLDITDPGGNIVERGALTVSGSLQAWGADNGRWTLDFADGKTAHVIACAGNDYGCSGDGYVLSVADFSNPAAPVLDSTLNISDPGWSITARFDSGRMYLSPSDYYYSTSSTTTPLDVYDLSNPMQPKLAGEAQIPGQAWIIIPSGNQLFELGQTDGENSSQVSLTYLDVTNAASPTVIGTSTFGNGWAWTPAADTFKAFTMNPTKGLVVLPFSGWDASNDQYNNGVQLIEYTPTSIKTAGAAHTHGWVERGIFVGNRIVSLSDLALSVVDYSNPMIPTVKAELTLARNVIAAQPGASTIAEVSSDWWGNDTTTSQVRVLPLSDPGEQLDESSAPQVNIDGVNANVFTNGDLTYIVTTVQVPGPCGSYYGSPSPSGCTVPQEQIQVVDLSNGAAKLRGKVALPVDPNSYFYWGGLGWYGGYYWYDWYDGAEAVQVEGDALAFRRWAPNYNAQGDWVDASSDLFIVDLSNPDAPTVSSTIISHDQTTWWGDMQVVGSTLYTMHYDWEDENNQYQTVRYYLDRIDLSDRAHPQIEAKINVPGMLVGGSSTDPSILYTSDYQWTGTTSINTFNVVQVSGNTATLRGSLTLDGWAGNIFVRGNTAYTSVQVYDETSSDYSSWVELHQIDLSDPSNPVDYASTGKKGWGWLLDVQGDRALVTSGWGDSGIDVYRLSAAAAPAYDQFLRTNGWAVNASSRQGNTLFLSSGYWGVESFTLH